MNLSMKRFFERLERTLDRLKGQGLVDNEAMRHDLIIRPLLKDVLGWNDHELHAQQTVYSPVLNLYDVQKSHKLRPDIIVVPEGFEYTAAVIEEKREQKHIDNLRKHIDQLRSYQCALQVVWGLLTDGELWILQRNFETHLTFETIDELRRGFPDLQECIGKERLLRRFSTSGTMDLIIIPPQISFGGIKDFDPKLLDLKIQRDAKGIPLPLLQQSITNIKFEGFTPIISISPMKTVN